MDAVAEPLRRMVDELVATGCLPGEWRDTFLAVPRHQFIPDTIWLRDSNIASVHDLVPLRRAAEPGRWLTIAYADDAVITQVDDGDPTGPDGAGRAVSSSASQPTVVALMLAAAGIDDGTRICEIGTGTGYNAALLAQRLGSDRVTTIEVDPAVAEHARAALHRAGYSPTLVVGDGALGHPPNAPYDRFLATCAVQDVPYAWVEQTRPGGRIVTPWGTAYHNGGLLALTVHEDGVARGGLVGAAAFMWLRSQRLPRVSVSESVYAESRARISHTCLHPAHVVSDHDAATAIGIRVPRCKYLYSPASDDSGEFTLWLIDQVSRSWASIDYVPVGDHYEVNQLGPRNLWDEVEEGYRWWQRAGGPAFDQWQFTVTARGQLISL